MKRIKAALMLFYVIVILFTSAFFAYGIGFVAEEAYASVFVVRSGNSLGSGFAIGNNCIVTNAHVIGNSERVSVLTYEGTSYKAQVLGMDENRDIAVLITSDVEFPVLKIADGSSVNVGDDIYTIGAPKSMDYTLTKGIVSAKERSIGRYSYIQIDAPINEGNSGGPLLNDVGQVIGMNTLKITDSEGLGLAIPMSSICDYVQSLGIELDTDGNAAGAVVVPDTAPEETQFPGETASPDREENRDDETEPAEESEGVSAAAIIASTIAVISIVVNVILAKNLKRQRQINQQLIFDPRERTDFEIDILE